MLFQNQKNNPAKLSQNEREAVVDLLHLCLYADAHISLKEGDFISDVVEVIGWDESLSFATYESRSVAAARAVRTDEKRREEFIGDAVARLKSPASKEVALSLCRDLCATDGMDPREEALLGRIESALDS